MRGLLILLACFLTLYAPLELSRVIIEWGLAPEFMFELTFTCVLYILALSLVSVIVQRYYKNNQGVK